MPFGTKGKNSRNYVSNIPNNTVVRKKFTNMTNDQKNQLISSILKLKNTPSPSHWNNIIPKDTSYWDAFVLLHGSQPPANLIAHRASGFLPWHRLLLLLLEKALHSVGYPQHLGFPYWQWDDPKDIIQISKSQFGEIRPDNLVKIVETGDFGRIQDSWKLRVMVSKDWQDMSINDTSYIRRNWGGLSVSKTEPQLEGAASVSNLRMCYTTYSSYPYDSLTPDNKQVFSNTLEGFTVSDGTDEEPRYHNLGHVNIGGTMANCLTSINDPIFFLHHTNVDREWALWQDTWQKSVQEKRRALNIPLSIIGKGVVSNDGNKIYLDIPVANKFAQVLYRLMSETINDSDFPIPTVGDLTITMDEFVKPNKNGVSLMGYIIDKVEGILLHITSDYVQNKLEQYLDPKVWYNKQLNQTDDNTGYYQYFTILSEAVFDSYAQKWILHNDGIWFWMQNMWVVQNITQDRIYNNKAIRILGGRKISEDTYQIIDLDTDEDISFLDKNNPLDSPVVEIGDRIILSPSKFYMESMKNTEGLVFPTMHSNKKNSLTKVKDDVVTALVVDLTDQGLLKIKVIHDWEQTTECHQLPDKIALSYNNAYKDIKKSDDPNSQTLFIGSRFGHNVYDILGHFNSINEIGMPIDMVDNDKLTYLSNGKQMVARVIYE